VGKQMEARPVGSSGSWSRAASVTSSTWIRPAGVSTNAPDGPLRVAPVRISSSNCDGSSLRRRSTVSRSLVARRTEDGGRADDPSGVPVIQVSRWLGHAPPATLLHPRAVEPDAPLGCGDFGFAEMSDAAATVSM
jgi:hypothetical protein